MTAPIPMLLHCPLCSTRHVDAGLFATKPHHTHACQQCGHVWRPAVEHTVGVQFLPGYRAGEALPLSQAARTVFEAFAPLVKRILARDPYAHMEVALDPGSMPDDSCPDFLLRLYPSGMADGEIYWCMSLDASDATLDDIFQQCPPARMAYAGVDLAKEGPSRTAVHTPVDPVPPEACVNCGQEMDKADPG